MSISTKVGATYIVPWQFTDQDGNILDLSEATPRASYLDRDGGRSVPIAAVDAAVGLFEVTVSVTTAGYAYAEAWMDLPDGQSLPSDELTFYAVEGISTP